MGISISSFLCVFFLEAKKQYDPSITSRNNTDGRILEFNLSRVTNRATFMIWKIFTFHVLRLGDNVISLILYGNDKFNNTKNKKILVSNIRFIENSEV